MKLKMDDFEKWVGGINLKWRPNFKGRDLKMWETWEKNQTKIMRDKN